MASTPREPDAGFVAAAAGVPGARPPQPPPPIDIENLAEQVLQLLDRRIIAQRERMGRPAF
jgi:hypothetical protein